MFVRFGDVGLRLRLLFFVGLLFGEGDGLRLLFFVGLLFGGLFFRFLGLVDFLFGEFNADGPKLK